MGIDVLDIAFRLEREFDVDVDIRRCFETLGRSRDPTSEVHAGLDMQVQDLAEWVRSQMQLHGREVPSDLLPRVQRKIAECLSVDFDEIEPTSWLHRDLGMD